MVKLSPNCNDARVKSKISYGSTHFLFGLPCKKFKSILTYFLQGNIITTIKNDVPLRFRYQSINFGEFDLHIKSLKDTNQYFDPENIAHDLGIGSAVWSLFGVIWPSGEILAELMLNYPVKDKRILEIGCGLALSSLVLNKRDADITATDYNPIAEDFLKENILLNGDSKIPFQLSNWEEIESDLGQFDLIIGSDLLYYKGLPEVLSNYILRHSKPNVEVIIIDPNRGQNGKFIKEMTKLGFSFTQEIINSSTHLNKEYKGRVLKFSILN